MAAEKELADWRTLLSHYDELIQSAHYHTNHFQNCQGRLVRRLEQSVMPDCADWCTVRRTTAYRCTGSIPALSSGMTTKWKGEGADLDGPQNSGFGEGRMHRGGKLVDDVVGYG